ncbi:MAG: cytochrome C [Melioribacteraceae bacterium]
MDQIKCLNCHEELRDIISLNRGYHSNKEVTSKKCWSCHGDHYGRNFEIVRFNEKKFDHLKSGYELIGSHKNLDCNKCHNSNFIENKRLELKSKTFLGLDKRCLTCHEDEHQGTLNSNCETCHNLEKFSQVEKFNHNDAKYILTGKHKEVDCNKCHTFEQRNNKRFQIFTGIKYQTCNSCHSDVHKGNFGTDCKSCHNTESFLKVSMSKNFNHSRTKFPLIGKHRTVSCKSCHKNSLSDKPKYKMCLDCHIDFHKGEFVNNNATSDCKDCHSEYGFSPSHFTLEKHNNTKFLLTGAHNAVACIDCHKVDDNWKFRISGETCITCHENVHANSISKKYFNENKCETCHVTTTWQEVKFEHTQTGFELIGKHKKTNCSSCHFDNEKLTSNEKQFVAVNSNCSSCHTDIHRGQFVEDGKELCIECHNFDNWEPTLFNHENTKFKIEGAHKQVQCFECHKPKDDEEGNYFYYKNEDVRCISCHS